MRRKVTAMLVVLLSITSILCTSIAAQAEVIHETDLEDYILSEMSSAHVLGMGISIVSAEKELYCAAYGMAQKTEADYVLGSLSKSLTAAGIMRMVEDSDISLEDTVSDYLSDYDAIGDVTIQELLNQTSGITYEQTMSDMKADGTRGEFEDSNANYNLLGEIIESVSGMAYEEYISDNILDSLEMSSTYSMRHDSQLGEGLLTGYRNYFGFPFASKHDYTEDDDWMQVPSAYMISDAKDMGKYLQMYLQDGGDVLSADSVDSMLYGGVEIPADASISEDMFGGSAKYGMGWIEKEVDGETLLYLSGEVENYTATMVLIPDQDIGIVMLFNSMDSLVGKKLMEKLEEGIVSIELGKTPEKIDSNWYYMKHGIIDVIMILVIIAAWMPIFLMSVWCRKRREKLLNIPGIIVDVVVNLILPTVLLFLLPHIMPTIIAKRFVPDLYYVACGVIATLYLGALVKVIAGIVLTVMGPKEDDETVEASDSEETKDLKEEKDSKSEDIVDKTEEGSKTEESETDKTEEEAESEESKTDKAEEEAESDESKTDKAEGAESDESKTDKAEEAETSKEKEAVINDVSKADKAKDLNSDKTEQKAKEEESKLEKGTKD